MMSPGKKILSKTLFFLFFAITLFPLTAIADTKETEELGFIEFECPGATKTKELVEKAAQYIRDKGTEPAFTEFSKKESDFFKEDKYIFVLNDKAAILAHPFIQSLIGKDMSSVKDPDGLLIFKLFVDIKDRDWVEYRWSKGKQPLKKIAYVINVDGYRVVSSIYCQK